MQEKRERIEDTLHSCKSAYSEGTVIGGGFALVYASINTEEAILDNI